jgi:hypothetical protein
LKKPPPFVPSCLIAICDAAGPSAGLLGDGVVSVLAAVVERVRRSTASRVADEGVCRREVLHDALETSTSARTNESGSRM